MPNQNRIILLVEDDPATRRMYRTALVLEGFHVHEATSGYEALAVLDQDTADLLVLDLGLPGIDGLSVLADIQAQGRNLPVVVVTGTDLNLDDVRAECILRKPISGEKLVETVKECLAKHR